LNPSIEIMPTITVQDLLNERASQFQLQLLAGGKGLNNKVAIPRIQKPGLTLAGYLAQVHPERIQILGKTEISYLKTLSKEEARQRIQSLCRLPISCFIITTNLNPPAELIDCANSRNIPLLKTPALSSVIISRLTSYLEERLAPETTVHGVLMDVFGVGVLIQGKSGVGKSECALELIVRGHRLVSDDVVRLKLRSAEVIIGSSPSLTRYLIEIRGLGILNIKDLFGVTAVRYRKRVELLVNLKPWREETYERLGLEEQTTAVLGVELPVVNIPVGPGRNLAVIIEVAARNQLLKLRGYSSAEVLDRKLIRQIKRQPVLSTDKSTDADIE
jgi:HPr kinase/phosphorylase